MLWKLSCCYGLGNPLSNSMEEKESINENISGEELESASGGGNTDRRDLKREIQERNRATDRRFRLRRNIPRDD